jgi:large subunit ribosomal protein L36
MRALSLSARPTTMTLPPVQTRYLSQAVLSTPYRTTLGAGAVVPAVQSGVAVFQKTQARGMKVRSAIKKRCEHCKVRDTQPRERGGERGGVLREQRLILGFSGRPAESEQAA